MDELTDTIDKVLSASAAQVASRTAPSAWKWKRRLQVKFRDGSQKHHDLAEEAALGVWNDRALLAEQLKQQGLGDVQGVELPTGPNHKEELKWRDTLSRAFLKAWMQRVDHLAFIQKLCDCGEGLLDRGLYEFALTEVYDRLSDRMLELNMQLQSEERKFEVADIVSACVRFYLGRCMALYQVTLKQDEGLKRPDTINALQDVLRDILVAVKLVNDQEASVREDMYWAIYNSGLLALRICRRMRLSGFGGVGVPTLWWLSLTTAKYLPLMGVHMLPFRMRFQQEIICCAESVGQLAEAQRVCKASLEQIEKAQKLEEVLPPVPEETQKIFDGLLTRFKILKLKYDFWLGELPNAAAVWAPAEAEGGAGHAVACLLEALELRHDLPSYTGGEVVEEVTGPPGQDAPDGPAVLRLSHAEVHAKQCDLLEVLAEKVKPMLEKVDGATKFLDEFTRRRLAYEADQERRARQHDACAAPAEGDDAEERPEEPEPPSADQLAELGFVNNDGSHTIEDMLPLAAHVLLMRESLRHEVISKGGRLQGNFTFLEQSLARRLRYRHFFSPPILDLDVIQTTERSREKVDVPDKYEVISEDLNALAQRNRQSEGDAAAGGEGELHVFVIAQRYNAWERWTGDDTAKVERISNVRIVFSDTPPKVNPRDTGSILAPESVVPGDVAALGAPKPWLEQYASGSAGDFSHFDHSRETAQATAELLGQVQKAGLVSPFRTIPVPIEPHPGAPAGAGTPWLVFTTFEEQKLASLRDASLAPEMRTLLPSDKEMGAVEDGDEERPVGSEDLLPPWSPMLDDVLAACKPVTNVAIFASKHMHAVVPNCRFNSMVRCDLRQTPHELRGKAFQTYIFMCTAVRAPSLVGITRALRICRAAHELHLAGTAEPSEATVVASGATGADDTEGEPAWHRPPLMNRLVEFVETLGRITSGQCGQLFLLDSADLLEDLCAHAFLGYVWPKLRFIQDTLLQHEQGERALREYDLRSVSEWSSVLRRVAPTLFRVLSEVQSLDGTTLCSAASAIANLFLEDNSGAGAKDELGSAIARLEADIAGALGTSGPQPAYDLPTAMTVSFDPPSLRPPHFAFFGGENFDGAAGATLVLRRHDRTQQDRVCLLMRLYEQWLDSSLKAHLSNVKSTVRRKVRPSEKEEVENQLAGANSSRLALSNPEAAVLAPLGENPYLRCLFFTAVARRRPEAAVAALAKACDECEAAVSQEVQLWAYCESELVRQQELLRADGKFGSELTKLKPGRKPTAHPPLPLFRSPSFVRLRVPPLPGGERPPVLASAHNFGPPEEVAPLLAGDDSEAAETAAAVRRWYATNTWPNFNQEWHSQQLGVRSSSTTPATCVVYAKPTGAGTAVAEIHCDLLGSGVRKAGYSCVDISDLKPNTNYSFATMCYEGFEAARPSVSTVSESSPPIGTYYPLPIALLRVELCKEALLAGKAGESAWRRAWPPLLDSMCEASRPEETYDDYGLRTLKLRLDVADRMPSVVLAAFADVLLRRHAGVRRSKKLPATRAPQQAVLRATNECLIAADCARRAANGGLTFLGVSQVLALISQLLPYRTKPQQLFTVLVKCAVLLDAFDAKKYVLAWHAETRKTVTYLLHQVSVMCVQLRQVSVLNTLHTGSDRIERYATNALAHPDKRYGADCRVLEHALQLALLGGVLGSHAEEKAALATTGQEGATEILALLKDLIDRNFDKVVKDSAQVVLQQQEQEQGSLDGEGPPERRDLPLSALALLRCGASRVWANAAGILCPAALPPPPPADPKAKKGEAPPTEPSAGDLAALAEALAEVLSKHRLGTAMDKYLEIRKDALEDYGFLLRALPVVRMQRTPEVDEEAQPDASDAAAQALAPTGDETPASPAAETTVLAAPAPDPMAVMGVGSDAAALAHLEMMRAAPLLKELQGLNLHWHDISRFRFLDLQQVADELSTSEDATGGDDPLMDTSGTDAAGADDGDSAPAWKKKEQEDLESQKKALEILAKAMRPLARAAVYALSIGADQLLFTAVIAALNALLLVGPLPSECVPPGQKANPMDTDPDSTVGAPPPEPNEDAADADADATAVPETVENDLWLNLSILSQSLVSMLRRLQGGDGDASTATATAAQEAPGATAAAKAGQDGEGDEAEAAALQEAFEAQEAMRMADEELHDMWFEGMPSVDIASCAKLVAFTALCLYNMQRWNSVIGLCRKFNDVTCSIYATTFLRIAIGAQGKVCELSRNAIANTERYQVEAKAQFIEQKNALPRKLVRQLALQGALSEPEKLYNERCERYGKVMVRQRRLDQAWNGLHKAMTTAFDLADRVVPIAVKQLTRSRGLLAKYLEDKRKFLLDVHRGELSGPLQAASERALRLAAMALVSSYKKSVELLRKRQVTDKVVQALHELGNLQWLEGDAAGARNSWSDAVDVAFEYVYAIKNWRACLETSVSPPSNAGRAELMLLTVVVLAKHARLTMPRDMAAHLNAALFASGIVEAVLGSGLPHPCRRLLFAPPRYRLREVFLGLRATEALLTPSSLHGGLDGVAFCSALSFFHKTLFATSYQIERCLPICSLFCHVATDVCRSRRLTTRGRLLASQALVRSRSFADAWRTLFSLTRCHDMPRPMLAAETLDSVLVDARDEAEAVPFADNEEPFSEGNLNAVNKLADLVLIPADADPQLALSIGARNGFVFALVQAEFLVSLCSYGRLTVKLDDQESQSRKSCLAKAEAKLAGLWKDVTGNEDDIEGWDSSVGTLVTAPAREVSEEDREILVQLRLLRAWIWEIRGDLGKAIKEVLHAMSLLQMQAIGKVASTYIANGAEASEEGDLWTHSSATNWMLLRQRLVHLLVCQGRLQAAVSHIEEGLKECADLHDDVSLVALLSEKVRVDIQRGVILEMKGPRRLGAVATAERCLEVAGKELLAPTPSVIYARVLLCQLYEQNPTLKAADVPPPKPPPLPPGKAAAVPQVGEEVDEESLLEAAGQIVISPLARYEIKQKKQAQIAEAEGPVAVPADRGQEIAREAAASIKKAIEDIDAMMRARNGPGLDAPDDLHPGDMNFLFRSPDDPAVNLDLQLLPKEANRFRERPVSDTREKPNVYLPLAPMRLRCELILARLMLDVGDVAEAEKLLKESELRTAHCVYLLPWLFVEFCVLKLRWRRLCFETRQNKESVPSDAPNNLKYRDPRAFEDGVCPPASSSLFRAFLARAKVPSLTDDSQWMPREDEDLGGMEGYLGELLGIIRIAIERGGHDYGQLLALLREGIEETLRVRPVDGAEGVAARYNQLHALFAAVVAVVECRKALQFMSNAQPPPEDPKAKDAKGKGDAAGAPAPVDSKLLPPRVVADLQHNLKRQAYEGALAYNAAAQEELKTAVPFRVATRHVNALRRECEVSASLFQEDRLLCDQLHTSLAAASPAYAKAKVLSDPLLVAISTPTDTPQTGAVLFYWVKPSAHEADAALGVLCGYVAFVCPSAGSEEDAPDAKPLVSRCSRVRHEAARTILDGLSTDLEHCRPAANVDAGYLAGRLRGTARLLRGEEPEVPEHAGADAKISAPPLDEGAEAQLRLLLGGLRSQAADAEPLAAGDALAGVDLDAQGVCALLEELLLLLDRSSAAASVTHSGLGGFLRAVLTPLAVA